jgi:hypothetical protein
MFEQKLVVGRYIDLPNTVTAPAFVGAAVAGFHGVVGAIRHIDESERPTVFHAKKSTTGLGAHGTARRNFMWLPWEPAVVTEVQVAAVDVLTGPMSGCWITRYPRGGNTYVGHVGTDTDPVKTAAAKAAWNGFTGPLPGGTATGFRPLNDWAGPIPNTGGNKGMIYALVTAAGLFYSVFTAQQGATTNLKIVGIQQIASTLPANGQI